MIYSMGRGRRAAPWSGRGGALRDGGDAGAGARDDDGPDGRMASACDARRTLRRARAAPGASFGFLFRWAEETPDDPDAETRLASLAQAMAEDECVPWRAGSGLPAIVPIFGQLLEHDLTAMADARTTAGRSPEAAPLRPRARDEIERSLVNLRDGTLELESLYGVDAVEGPLAEKLARLSREPGAPARLRLDTPAPSARGRMPLPLDRGADLPRLGRALSEDPREGITEAEIMALPRRVRRSFLRDGAVNPARALIGDLRNDGSLPLAQLHVALARFHNRVVDELVDRGATPPERLFEAARAEVRRHVQWLALNRWLPRLCDAEALARVRRAGAPFYTEMRNGVHEPGQRRQPAALEWWAAAARFRIAMTPGETEWNRFHPRADQAFLWRSTGAAMADGRLPADRVADWSLLAGEPFSGGPRGARAIGTNISPDDRHAALFQGLALSTLRKGHALNLPPAQACAAELNMVYGDLVRPLSREALCGGHTGEAIRDGMDERTPLWFYILREAEVQRDGRGLGQLGSAILAESVIGMIASDPASIWRLRGADGKPWSPADGLRPGGIEIDDFDALLEAAELL
ncbi:peroxidase family protein [Albimonas sp. CAU 1670]|uniref:peroxidase family protein n=1 Tax=Albimonas sp. CAU 1670 TaxID=3032599 RepID=UPI0023DA641A|nr:peroxidase family protein [Albimonas sp. CAU 1670]MDF2235776.1 peroxidase family protein [Albimonas sp. CAU 1670]